MERRQSGDLRALHIVEASIRWSRCLRWSALMFVLLGIVLVPFALFGANLEVWISDLVREDRSVFAVAVLGASLLVADIALPVPSSIVLTVLGATLGGIGGTLVGAAGLSIGCCLGYALGRAGERVAVPILGSQDHAMARSLLDRHALLVVAATRAIPVLAEVTMIGAGAARLAPLRCLAVALLANVGIAGAYSIIGTSVRDLPVFIAALAAAILVPFLSLSAAVLARRVLAATLTSKDCEHAGSPHGDRGSG
jgi:uncharacterized membrane protein YdjX (TVP38/TMEM64 family)